MNLNLLTGKQGKEAFTPIHMNEIQFWEYYLAMLNLRHTSNMLNPKELRVMAYVLANDPDKSHFMGTRATVLKQALRMKKSDLSKVKSNLVNKGFLEDTGVTRGDTIPTQSLRKFQKIIKEKIKNKSLPILNFIFAFDVNGKRRDNHDIGSFNRMHERSERILTSERLPSVGGNRESDENPYEF